MPEDEVQDTSVNESAEENQEAEGQKQSNEGEGEEGQSDSKRYELNVMGEKKEMTPDELYEYTRKINPEFTRRSQKLREYERKEQERAEKAKQAAQKGVANDELLKNVPSDVKSAITKLTQPLIEKALKDRDQKAAAQEKERLFDKKIAELEQKYPGGDGRPKFDKRKVLSAMRAEGNTNYDPESIFRDKLHRKEFLDYEIKQALKQKGKGHKTEKTGKGGARKPERKKITSFKDAANALEERLSTS